MTDHTAPQTPALSRTDWMTSADLQRYLQISERTMYRYMAQGLPVIQPGGPNSPYRFARHAVDEWMYDRAMAVIDANRPTEDVA